MSSLLAGALVLFTFYTVAAVVVVPICLIAEAWEKASDKSKSEKERDRLRIRAARISLFSPLWIPFSGIGLIVYGIYKGIFKFIEFYRLAFPKKYKMAPDPGTTKLGIYR